MRSSPQPGILMKSLRIWSAARLKSGIASGCRRIRISNAPNEIEPPFVRDTAAGLSGADGSVSFTRRAGRRHCRPLQPRSERAAEYCRNQTDASEQRGLTDNKALESQWPTLSGQAQL